MMNLSRISIVFIVCVLLGSCFENPDCLGLRNNLAGISFKKLLDGQADTIGIFGISVSGSDSVFSPLTNVSSIALPLNNSASDLSYTFNTTRGNFNIDLTYKTQTQFEEVNCGPRIIISDLAVTNHNFDSLRLISSSPSSDGKSINVEVYRCPFTNLMKIGFRQWLADDNEEGNPLVESIKGISVDYLPLTFYANSEISSAIVPLNTNNSFTQTTIESESGMATLTTVYSLSSNELFSVCGTQQFIDGVRVIGFSGYDQVAVQNDSVTDPPSTNVLFFRCPQTNLVEIILQNPAGVPTEFPILKVTANYTTEQFYVNESTSELILPLDELSDQTEFIVEFEDATHQVLFGYSRIQQTFHEQCNQTLFSSLEVLSSDFITAPVVESDSIQFPTVTNVEITKD